MIGFYTLNQTTCITCAVFGFGESFSDFAPHKFIVNGAALTHGVGRLIGPAAVEGLDR